MKKIFASFIVATAVLGTSCSKQLDINDNPNQATTATAELVLPQALTNTASVLNGYNTMGAQIGGYSANAGGYGGFGANITYLFTTEYTNLWPATYDNLNDYQAIINYTKKEGQLPLYSNFNAAANIMKAFEFQLLVDANNDVPYSEALQGANILTPKYDLGPAVYDSLAILLDAAIATIHEGMSTTETVLDLGKSDVMFGGDMNKWLQLANTIKLRLMVRGNGKVTFTNTSFDPAGFLETDALINPGYVRDANKQNPKWSNWAFDYTGTPGNKAWIPTTFIMGMYDGHTLADTGRGKAIYYLFPNTGTNRLGHEGDDIQKSPGGSFWYPSDNRDGKSSGNTTGVLKGPDAGFPVMIAAESYFLQAEAVVRGILSSGDAKELFQKGVKASFNYLYQLPNKSISGNPDADANKYFTDNYSSPLVNFDFATTTEQKIEAIITQKYIALNFVNSQEAWNDYRRTQYPTIKTPGDDYTTFASIVSESPRPDKLPTRILYPTSEGSYNGANMPTGITPTASLIFWAQ
ncbi:SusD/RagB family nutrient-binding outer membrane lipoprotein [Flavihumibacter profundi]|uniref:SusD/RagB family nutrient-binding outer membrane lipoprotein n=1 Tax=Flavihumibacter profundi TaxID=2716883 RepID=UPI001CC6EC16|nr:SusD/RagB family nutrient-binding outer membrane lipoprotein [Flavihumibacter profundi]MBZ5857124.1 SusD/RagB family nutrient-binding outer membrane lipoprotein [Flavihumibacter profundi]